VYLVIQNIQDHVFITIRDKKDATDFHFPFIDQDVRSEIDNLADPNGPNFNTGNLPKDFPQDLAIAQEANQDPNKDRIPVITMIPTIMPVGFGRDPPKMISNSISPKWHARTTTRAFASEQTPSTT
jgi:hypothetical protein